MKNILIVGGDLRNLHLYELIKKRNINVKIIGFDKINKEYSFKKQYFSNTDIIIGPIPFSTDDNIIFMPNNSSTIKIMDFLSLLPDKSKLFTSKHSKLLNNKKHEFHFITEDEDFALKNAIPTSEGILEILIRESNITIHNSKSLVLGFGRIGKQISELLKNLGSDITVVTNDSNEKNIACNKGFNTISTDDLNKTKYCFNFIINTIPYKYLNGKIIYQIDIDTIILDVASFPGGIDILNNKKVKCKIISAKGIPGKCAPATVASYIFNKIEHLL